MSPHFIRFARWISEYYLCGWGEILFLSLPKKIDIRPSKLKAWSNPLDKIIYQNYYSPTKNLFQSKKGSLADKLLKFIQTKKKISHDELRQNFPQSSAVLKKLLTKNIIEKKQERNDSFAKLFSKDCPPVVLNQEQNQVVQSCQKWLEKKNSKPLFYTG